MTATATREASRRLIDHIAGAPGVPPPRWTYTEYQSAVVAPLLPKLRAAIANLGLSGAPAE